MNLYEFQKDVLKESEQLNKVAYYYDMGLGKTFIGFEKLYNLESRVNLIVCQKSKIEDWFNHIVDNYADKNNVATFDLTSKAGLSYFLQYVEDEIPNLMLVGIINYELLFRRPELSGLSNFTLMLDESSLIQNETSKRSRFILQKLRPKNVILLSGTPTGGKYEKLWSQLYLLGWNISKNEYWNRYVDFYIDDRMGFPMKVVKGYKRVEELKSKMREYGCFFKRTDEVFSLPEQIFSVVKCSLPAGYNQLKKKGIVEIDKDITLVADSLLKEMLYERQLCGMYSPAKFKALKDLLESSDDRFIIFYNFDDELKQIKELCRKLDRPISVVNGNVKDLTQYERRGNSITLIQYQAGAMGLNLQKANRIVYFTPTLSSELYEQSKKRIHRIGQTKTCFYYNLTVIGSIEEKIYANLALRKDYTEKLFQEER